MNEALDKNWLIALSDWARGEPLIRKAWVFGSRVKGTSGTDSDLDVAIEIEPDDGKHLAEWIFSSTKWREEAQLAIGEQLRVDLQWANESGDKIVWPAVKDHGIMFYERKQ